MKTSLTSRQRMLAALACQPVDHIPCAFMLFKGLHTRSRSYRTFLEAQLELGLDTVVQLPPRPPQVVNDHYNLHGLPVLHDPQVSVKEWLENLPGEPLPVLVKEYQTPAGRLRAEVRQTRDWPWGNHVPLFDDHIEPRANKFLVETSRDLEPLHYLLAPPSADVIRHYRAESQPYQDFARHRGLLVSGGWGVGADMLGWLCGLTNMIKFTHRQPEFIRTLLELIAAWNRTRMQAVLSAGVDLYIKRAWYENCDFWTPSTWASYLQPILEQEVELAHGMGAKFGYILTSSAMHLIEPILAAGVDVLIGVDPREYDLRRTAELAAGRLCLWGGVNGHLTVERGTPQDVRHEVETSLGIFRDQPGFILSPVDNVRELTETSEGNIRELIQAWQSSSRAR